MYDGYEIAEYTNYSYLNEDVSNTKNLLLSSEIPICKEYTSCQYKEMEICFNDITIKEKIVSDNWVQATIINKENSIKNIKFSEDGGKNRKIERFKQTIDNIESLVQYCKNSLNSKDIARLG